MTDSQYSDFVGKRVTLTTEADGERVGTVAAANLGVVMFTPKGTSFPEMIDNGDVKSIDIVPEKPRKLTQKAMDALTPGRARRHLLDYHGYELAVVNDMTDDEAESVHYEIDHEPLGHHHDGRKSSGEDSDGEADSQ